MINRVTFSISPPDNGWPAGMYRAELYIAGTLDKKISFKVVQQQIGLRGRDWSRHPGAEPVADSATKT